MIGIVIFSSRSNYKVLYENEVINCKLLGKLKKDGISPIVGDYVIFNCGYTNIITKIMERKNTFLRPNVCNIDNSLIFTSLKEPLLNDYLLDKFITIFQIQDIKPILIFTKYDLVDLKLNKDRTIMEKISEYKDAGYKVILFKKQLSESDLNFIKRISKDKVNLITGQTGVGKSTFLNYLNPEFNIKTQQISLSLNRGKHTTKNSKIYRLFGNSIFIDTPGFSSLNLSRFDKFEITHNFFNFNMYSEKCKFNNCLHINEKECNVIMNERIKNNYTKLLKELDFLK